MPDRVTGTVISRFSTFSSSHFSEKNSSALCISDISLSSILDICFRTLDTVLSVKWPRLIYFSQSAAVSKIIEARLLFILDI